MDQTAWVDKLKRGAVALFPTDTVYGIGASSLHAGALDRIFEVKQRPRSKPLPVLISGWEMLKRLTPDVERVRAQVEDYWPGALTVLVPLESQAQLELSPLCFGDGTVAVRWPRHPVLCELIEALGHPLAATSANLSGNIEVLSVSAVDPLLTEGVDLVWDEEIPARQAVPSTIVDLTADQPYEIRPGGVRLELKTGPQTPDP